MAFVLFCAWETSFWCLTRLPTYVMCVAGGILGMFLETTKYHFTSQILLGWYWFEVILDLKYRPTEMIFCSWFAVRNQYDGKMISFCSQLAILGRKILNIQNLCHKAVLKVFLFSREPMVKWFYVPRFDPITAHIFFQSCWPTRDHIGRPTGISNPAWHLPQVVPRVVPTTGSVHPSLYCPIANSASTQSQQPV